MYKRQVYPLTNFLKIVVTYFSNHNAQHIIGLKAAHAMEPVAHAGSKLRKALIWSLRVVSASHAYSPLPDSLVESSEQAMGYALVPPLYTQMFDVVLSICDIASVGVPALTCTALALPVSS